MQLQMPDSVYLELIGYVNPYVGTGVKIFMSIVLGMVIGIDREKKLKAAGLKTQVLICLGATLYTSIAFLNFSTYGSGTGDPNRVAAQIVSGIGFLGAGSILHSKGAVFGMTTAATVWVVAAMGVAIGSGFIVSASLFAITTLVVLNMVEPMIRWIQPEKHYFIEVKGDESVADDIDRALEKFDSQILSKEVFNNEINHKCNIHIHLRANNRDFKKIIEYCNSNSRIEQYTFKTIK